MYLRIRFCDLRKNGQMVEKERQRSEDKGREARSATRPSMTPRKTAAATDTVHAPRRQARILHSFGGQEAPVNKTI